MLLKSTLLKSNKESRKRRMPDESVDWTDPSRLQASEFDSSPEQTPHTSKKLTWWDCVTVLLCVGAGVWATIEFWSWGPFSVVPGFAAFAGTAYVLQGHGV